LRLGIALTGDSALAEAVAVYLPIKRKKLSRNGYRSNESICRLYLVRHLGTVKLRKLQIRHVRDMFEAIEEHNEEIVAARASKDPVRIAAVRYQRPVGPTSLRRIREVLRALLNWLIREEVVDSNPAKWVEMPPAVRPKPKLWTPGRVEEWRRTGKVPGPVMIWTPEQTGRFLDHIVHHRLYALFMLIAHVGLRRGEGCGALWPSTDLDAGFMLVDNQIVQYGWETGMAPPKTTSSEGLVALNPDLVLVLRAHKARQDQERAVAGDAWVETGGLMFTKPDGGSLHPADVTDEFHLLVKQAGLPPIRLHDLRHGAATLALAAGVEMKVVQEMLRHSSITITSDTYTSVLPQVAQETAAKVASMIPRSRLEPLGLPSGSQGTTVEGEQMHREHQKAQVDVEVSLGFGSAPPGTRTPNPLVKSQLLCQLS
jgi:integrase